MVSHLQLQEKLCKLCIFTPSTSKGSHARYVAIHVSILYIMELRRSVFLGPFRILRGVPSS